MKRLIFYVCVIGFGSISYGQDCSSIKHGTFYSYPRNSYVTHEVIITRQDTIETMIDELLGDTSIWKFDITNNCVVNLKFIRNTKGVNEFQSKYFYSDIYREETTKITREYYTYRGFWVQDSTRPYTDTIWRKPHRN